MPRSAILAVFLLFTLFAGTAQAQRISVADPAGGARWTARQTAGEQGRVCVRLMHGKLNKGTSCARLSGQTVSSYNLRTYSAANPRAVRTVILAAFSEQVVRAQVQTPDGQRSYRRRAGRPRILLAVLAGRVERPTLRAEVKLRGRTRTVVTGPEPAVQVADPLGGTAWRSLTAAGSGGGVCVGWERVPPRFEPVPTPARGAPRCGDPAADVPVAAAQVVDGRLVVFGLGGARVRSALLRGPAGDRTLALEPSTRALLAVLPGDTDPATLTVIAKLGDGREVARALDVVK
jgi:hypothetical protein